MKMLVFAGSYNEYRHMMQAYHVSYLHKDWVYVKNVERVICCLRHTPYILFGTWYERTDRAKFLKLAKGKGFVRMERVEDV